MIGAQGENLGVMARADALALARPEESLDLIEISPAAMPPVVRLMSFDKYRYEHEKAEKKERQAQRHQGVKRVQISARAAPHDLEIKSQQLQKFLAEGHPVEVFVRLRGREKYLKDWAQQKLVAFLKMIPIEYKMLGVPKFAQGLSVQIIKK